MYKYQILKDLVKFNTIKDKENKEIINYIQKYLLKYNFKTEYKSKCLIMSIGENPKLGFLGHTDTVEFIEGWNTNPLELVEKDGKLYGLGACDMKGGIAAMLDAISEIDFTSLSNGIKLYFTYDEEINFEGIKEILEVEKKFPEMMIFGEPTNNEIISGTKGLLEYKLEFKGIKTHSSNPVKGKSANMNAIKFIYELEKFYSEKIKTEEEKSFEIPYTTMNVGIISGGSAPNSISAECKVALDFRVVKSTHIQKIKDKVNDLCNKYDGKSIIIESLKPFINKSKITNQIKTANFITEASLIKNNVSRIILGPGPVTAHEINEYITCESYDKLVEQYIDIIHKVCK